MHFREALAAEQDIVVDRIRDQWHTDVSREDHRKVWRRKLSHRWSEDHVTVFVLEADGNIVSSLVLYDLNFLLREKKIRVGGIGEVITPEEYRRKGFATALMEGAIERMKEDEFDLSLLFAGIPEFYRRLGYWSLKTISYDVDLMNLEDDRFIDLKGNRIRAIEKDDREGIADLYNASMPNRLLFMLRDGDYRDYQYMMLDTWDEFTDGHVFSFVAEREGIINAYLITVCFNDRLYLEEYGFREGHKDCMTAMLLEAMKKGVDKGALVLTGNAPTRFKNICPSRSIEIKEEECMMLQGVGSKLTIGPGVGNDDYFMWNRDSF